MVFFITLFLTILIGGSVLYFYSKLSNDSKKVLVSSNGPEESEAPEENGSEYGNGEGETSDLSKNEKGDSLKIEAGATKAMSQKDAGDPETAGEEKNAKRPGAFGSAIKPEESEAADETIAGDEASTENSEATMVFAGDVCFHDPYSNMAAYRDRGSDISKCISDYLLSQMRDADICMVNNEFPYTDRETPLEGKMYTFKSKPSNVSILKEMGVDIVSVANNHAYDQGRGGFEDTVKTIRDSGVKLVGGGMNLEEASKAEVFEVGGMKIGILAATQIERNDNPDTKGATSDSAGVLRCYSKAEQDHFAECIQKAKSECDFLVVFMHWGTESTDELDWAQPGQADMVTKNGADLVVGCHPHCLQGMDVVNGVPVIYSLGNYWFNSKTVDTALLKVVVKDKKIDKLQMIAALQSGCSTKELTEGERVRVLQYLQSISPNVKLDEKGYVSW